MLNQDRYDYLLGLGFKVASDNESVVEAEFNSDNGCYLADALGIESDFESLIIQYDADNDTVTICIDGDVDICEYGELVDALEGE